MQVPEPFVDASEAGKFLSLPPARILRLARQGLLPGHPIGNRRKTWRFLRSELAACLVSVNNRKSSFAHEELGGKSLPAPFRRRR
jgi:hypothetical protein